MSRKSLVIPSPLRLSDEEMNFITSQAADFEQSPGDYLSDIAQSALWDAMKRDKERICRAAKGGR